MVWAGKEGKGTRVDRGEGEELAVSPQPCLAGRGGGWKGPWRMETACSIPSLLLPGIPGSPGGCLGTAKSSKSTYCGVGGRVGQGCTVSAELSPGRASHLWGLRFQGYLSVG